jgi:hypothetical protein
MSKEQEKPLSELIEAEADEVRRKTEVSVSYKACFSSQQLEDAVKHGASFAIPLVAKEVLEKFTAIVQMLEDRDKHPHFMNGILFLHGQLEEILQPYLMEEK